MASMFRKDRDFTDAQLGRLPSDIGVELLNFRTRQQGAIAQRMQAAILVDPLLLIDEDSMHQRNLALRPSKADATNLE